MLIALKKGVFGKFVTPVTHDHKVRVNIILRKIFKCCDPTLGRLARAHLLVGSDDHDGRPRVHPLPVLLGLDREEGRHGQRYHLGPHHVWCQVSWFLKI